MKNSLRKGISFGRTSAVSTTLGLMVGLNSGTHSKMAVLAGILAIGIADAFSDALGIRVSEEAENTHTHRQIGGAIGLADGVYEPASKGCSVMRISVRTCSSPV